MAREGGYRGLYASFPIKAMNSEAFKSISKIAQLTIFYLDKFYWESDRRNPIPIPQLWLSELIGCSPGTSQKILTELDDYGFLERVKIGTLKGPIADRAACYILTWRHDNSGGLPKHTWRKVSKQLARKSKK